MDNIGLSKGHLENVANKLNKLLSDYHIHYQNLRAMHWLVKGPNFFQLHEAFEKMYDDAAEKIDEIAERVLILGFKPLHKYEQYLSNAEIKELEEVGNEGQLIERVKQDLQVLLKQEREVDESASDASDEGTIALMTELIPEQEKLLWMLNAMQN